MPCLVCGKRIPLLLRLSGSPFCSPAHERQPATLPESAVSARPSPPPMMPELARFALSEPEIGPIGACPDRDRPLPRFQDLILNHNSFSVSRTMGFRGATTIASVPRASRPGAGRAIGVSTLNSWATLRLSLSAAEALEGGRTVPSLRGAPPYPRGPLAARSFAGARGSRPPVNGHTGRLEIRSPVSLPVPAGLRAFQEAFPLSLDTFGPPAPRPAANPLVGFDFRIVRTPPEPAHNRREGPQALSYRGEWFSPLDSMGPIGGSLEPCPFPANIGLLTSDSV